MKFSSDAYNYNKNQDIADRAYVKKLSVFGMAPFMGKRESLGQIVSLSECRGIKFKRFLDEPFFRLKISESVPVDEAIYVANKQNMIIGYALPNRQYDNSVSVITVPELGEKQKNELRLYRCK